MVKKLVLTLLLFSPIFGMGDNLSDSWEHVSNVSDYLDSSFDDFDTRNTSSSLESHDPVYIKSRFKAAMKPLESNEIYELNDLIFTYEEDLLKNKELRTWLIRKILQELVYGNYNEDLYQDTFELQPYQVDDFLLKLTGKETPELLNLFLIDVPLQNIPNLRLSLNDLIINAIWQLNHPLTHELVYTYNINPNLPITFSPKEFKIKNISNRAPVTLIFEIIVNTIRAINNGTLEVFKSHADYKQSDMFDKEFTILRDLLGARGAYLPRGLFEILKSQAEGHPEYDELINYLDNSGKVDWPK